MELVGSLLLGGVLHCLDFKSRMLTVGPKYHVTVVRTLLREQGI